MGRVKLWEGRSMAEPDFYVTFKDCQCPTFIAEHLVLFRQGADGPLYLVKNYRSQDRGVTYFDTEFMSKKHKYQDQVVSKDEQEKFSEFIKGSPELLRVGVYARGYDECYLLVDRENKVANGDELSEALSSYNNSRVYQGPETEGLFSSATKDFPELIDNLVSENLNDLDPEAGGLEDPFFNDEEEEEEGLDWVAGDEETLNRLSAVVLKMFDLGNVVIQVSYREEEGCTGIFEPGRLLSLDYNPLVKEVLDFIWDHNHCEGTGWVYNDGSSERKSGYSKNEANVTVHVKDISEHEYVEGYMELVNLVKVDPDLLKRLQDFEQLSKQST